MNQKLKQKIIEVNPKKEWVETRCYGGEEYSDDVPIRLADVLLAWNKTKEHHNPMLIIGMWDLLKENNLETQIKANPKLGKFLEDILLNER